MCNNNKREFAVRCWKLKGIVGIVSKETGAASGGEVGELE